MEKRNLTKSILSSSFTAPTIKNSNPSFKEILNKLELNWNKNKCADSFNSSFQLSKKRKNTTPSKINVEQDLNCHTSKKAKIDKNVNLTSTRAPIFVKFDQKEKKKEKFY